MGAISIAAPHRVAIRALDCAYARAATGWARVGLLPGRHAVPISLRRSVEGPIIHTIDEGSVPSMAGFDVIPVRGVDVGFAVVLLRLNKGRLVGEARPEAVELCPAHLVDCDLLRSAEHFV
jgi:hypothetical protein